MMRKPKTSIFTRLLSYFLLILIFPTFSLTVYNVIARENRLRDDLSHQAALRLETDRDTIMEAMDTYRHKAYVISSSENILSIHEGKESNLSDVYAALFDVMKGDTYLADAYVISKDGSIRISTSIFPESYDIRVHNNDREQGNVLSEVMGQNKDPRSSIITLGQNRISYRGYRVLFSILRSILDKNSNLLGYTIIDVYSEAVIPKLKGSELFADEILMDKNSYLGYSLLHTDLAGTMDKFPDIDDKNMVVSKLDFNSFSLISVINPEPFRNTGKTIYKALSITLVFGVLISVIFTLIFSNSISKRLNKMIMTMRRIENGELDLTLEKETGITEFDTLAGSFNLMVGRISHLIEARSEEERKLREAERKAFESQLNPHFIFNTLSTIKSLARLDGEDKIYTISVELGRLLRSSLTNTSPESTVREALKLCEGWLKIQKIRFEDTLDYKIDADEETLDLTIPKLIIQPLVENAVIHGLEESLSQGCVTISVKKHDGKLEIVVLDDGKGLDNPELFKDFSKLENSGHVGIYNIYMRLKLKYGDNFEFSIQNGDKGTISRIVLPAEKKGDENHE